MDNSKEFQLMLDKAIKSEPLAFKIFDRTKNVQGQLQKIVEERTLTRIAIEALAEFYSSREFYKIRESYDKNGRWILVTYERLWLAFMMKEKYGKVWSGEDWLGESN